jgi:osmoprotectant transport system permease protein
MANILRYIENPQHQFGQRLTEYIQLCGSAILFAVLISVPLGLLLARRPLLAFLANNFSGLMRAIPSIAILVAFLPILGIGYKPAVIALTILGIPPILLNTTAAIRSIDPAITDSARGMGMSFWQVLVRVELPLALPVIITGVRTAGVQIVATGTLATIIGVPGLGYYIFLGLFGGIDSDTALLVGALSVAALAFIVEVTLAALQRLVTPAGVRLREDETANTSEASTMAASV